MKNKFSIIEKFGYATSIYGLMILLSFIPNYFFYLHFNIYIFFYVTPYELLFYFIPYFLINNIAVFLYFVPILVLIILLFKINCLKKIKLKFSHIFTKQKYDSFDFFLLGIFSLVNILIIIILFEVFKLEHIKNFIPDCILNFFSIKDFLHNVASYFIKGGSTFNFIFQIIVGYWGIILYKLLQRYFLKNKYNMFSFYLTFSIIFMFVFSNLKIFERISTMQKSLKEQKPIEKYEFIYSDKFISTDNNRIVIGTTKDFIFIRNLYKNENEIYNMADVKFLKITKY